MKRPDLLLITAILIDIASMTFYRYFPGQASQDYFYFSGQSISRLLYLLSICYYSISFEIGNLIAWTIIPFAISDSVECLFFDNTQTGTLEYTAFFVAMLIFAIKINRTLKKENDV